MTLESRNGVFSITEKGRSCLSNWAAALTDYENYIHQLVDMIRELN